MICDRKTIESKKGLCEISRAYVAKKLGIFWGFFFLRIRSAIRKGKIVWFCCCWCIDRWWILIVLEIGKIWEIFCEGTATIDEREKRGKKERENWVREEKHREFETIIIFLSLNFELFFIYFLFWHKYFD
jgi:hypothetical protein